MRPRPEIAINEIIFQLKETFEGGYATQSLGRAEAESLDELRENVRYAVGSHFDEGVGPKMIRLQFVRDEMLAA